MKWMLLTLGCILCWSAADLFYKEASALSDKLSHLKIMVWLGIIMGLSVLFLRPKSELGLPVAELILHYKEYAPYAILYVLALMCGVVGSRYLDVSVLSPLENVDGAVSALILLVYFAFTGRLGEKNTITPWSVASVLFVASGTVLLCVMEEHLARKERRMPQTQKKHPLGAVAFVFPILYTMVDASAMVFDSVMLAGGEDALMGQYDLLICEAMAFTVVGALSWIYLLAAKKVLYNPFQKGELTKCGAALTETVGNVFYAAAAAQNPLLTPPVTTSYCVISIFAARLFLKEKLEKKQYACLVLVVLGVALSAAAELIGR